MSANTKKSAPPAVVSNLASQPTLIEYDNLRFLISDAPKDQNLHLYLRLFKKFNATHVVRISEPLYNKEDVKQAGINLHEFHFPDGESPPDDIIAEFLDLVDATFANAPVPTGPAPEGGGNPCIVVHCVAGLGRAPVMVAIALIEKGLDAMSAVQFIRERRRGAINRVQLTYLESYIPRSSKKAKCTIM